MPSFSPIEFSDKELVSEPDSLEHTDKKLDPVELADDLEMHRRESSTWISYHQAVLAERWCDCGNAGQFSCLPDSWICQECWSEKELLTPSSKTCSSRNSHSTQSGSVTYLDSDKEETSKVKPDADQGDMDEPTSVNALEVFHEVSRQEAVGFGYQCKCGKSGTFFRLDTQWRCALCKDQIVEEEKLLKVQKQSQASCSSNATIEYPVSVTTSDPLPPSDPPGGGSKLESSNNILELSEEELRRLSYEEDVEKVYLGVPARELEVQIEQSLILDLMNQEQEDKHQLYKLSRKFRGTSSPGSPSTDPQLNSDQDTNQYENEMDAGELEAMDLEALEDSKAREELERQRLESQDEEEWNKIHNPSHDPEKTCVCGL